MTPEDLERDLSALAEPHADDERLRLAIGATLREQLRPAPRRRTRRAVGLVTLGAATIAAAVVALISTGGSGNAAILAHVMRASTPPANIVVHLKETGANPDGTPVSAEWWQETNAPYAMRLIKGIGGEVRETSVDGATQSEYDAATNTVYQQPDANAPTLIDPIETMRAGLTNGTAQIDGTVTIGGRSLYKIELPSGCVGYFDKTSYRPVYIDNPQRDGTVVRTEVTAYDELPITAESEKLLSVTAQHPDARVQQGDAPGPVKTR
jgi:hypothetical protein